MVVCFVRCTVRRGQVWRTRSLLLRNEWMTSYPVLDVVLGRLGLGGLFRCVGLPIRVHLRALPIRRLCGHVHRFPRYPCSARLCLPLSRIFCRRCMSGCWIGLRWVLLSLFCSTRSMLGGTVCASLGGSLGESGCMVSFRLRVGIGIVLAGVCSSGPLLGGASCPFP